MSQERTTTPDRHSIYIKRVTQSWREKKITPAEMARFVNAIWQLRTAPAPHGADHST